jgi:NTE family protein
MRIGVALSGGGLRAALFHLGVLRRVAELGWLPRVDALSGVSGGSIVAAFAALRWAKMLDAGGDCEAFEKHVAGPFIDVVTTRSLIRDWLGCAAGQGMRRAFDRTYSRTTALGDVLSEHLYDGKSCADLPESPYAILNATSLISVRAWRFTRDGLGDSRMGYADWRGADRPLSIGQAVAASAAFPPVFSPLLIDARQYAFSGTQYRDAPVTVPATIALTDGGVYENLGTEVLTKRTPLPGGRVLDEPEFLLVSDGGYPPVHRFTPRRTPGLASICLLWRVNGIAMEQVSALRRRRLTGMFEHGRPHGILVGLGSSIDRLPDGDAGRYRQAVGEIVCPPSSVVERIQRVRTHLNRFSKEEAEALMYHGYVLTDAFLWSRTARLPEEYRRGESRLQWEHVFDSPTVNRFMTALARSNRLW